MPPGKKFVEQTQGVIDDRAFSVMPFYLRSRANGRGTWQVRAKRDKECRQLGQWMGALCIKEGGNQLGWEPPLDVKWEVTMIRMSRAMLDSDNLVASFKSVRDGIADVLGQDDRWKGNIEWQYDQNKSREYGIRIELRRLKPT